MIWRLKLISVQRWVTFYGLQAGKQLLDLLTGSMLVTNLSIKVGKCSVLVSCTSMTYEVRIYGCWLWPQNKLLKTCYDPIPAFAHVIPDHVLPSCVSPGPGLAHTNSQSRPQGGENPGKEGQARYQRRHRGVARLGAQHAVMEHHSAQIIAV